MPALLIVLGIAAVVFIAAAGHHTPPEHRAVVVELDRGMPPSVVRQVLSALGHESDPARLEALGAELQMHFPLSARELHTRAHTLRGAPSLPEASGPSLASLPAPATLPKASPSAAPLPVAESLPEASASEEAQAHEPPPGARKPPDLDAAIVLQAAMRALVEETDPVVLDGFAASIRASYPTAAEILSDRALVLRTSAAAEGPPAAAVSPSVSHSQELS
jgi:hypothetical protein